MKDVKKSIILEKKVLRVVHIVPHRVHCVLLERENHEILSPSLLMEYRNTRQVLMVLAKRTYGKKEDLFIFPIIREMGYEIDNEGTTRYYVKVTILVPSKLVFI